MATDPRRRLLVPAISSVHFVQHVFRILPPMLPVLAVTFPYPLWQLGALVSVYFAGSGLGQAPAGVLADRHDRRLVLVPAVGLMGAGYLVFAAAPAVVSEGLQWSAAGATFSARFLGVALGAFLTGLGASAIHPAGYPLVAANADPETTGRAFGVWGGAAKLGDAAAPTAVALLVLVIDWQAVFLLFGVAGLGYAAVLLAVLSSDRVETRPATDRDATAADAPGERPTDRRRYRYPMAALVVFFVARAFSEKGLKAFLPLFLVGVYGYSFAVGGRTLPPESFANLYFTVVFVVAVPLQLLTGRLTDRTDHRAVLVGFMTVAALALAALSVLDLSPLALLAVLLVLGASNWGWTPARDALVNDVAPFSREGRTFGYLHTVSHLCSAAAPVAVGAVAGAIGLRASFLLLVAVTGVAVAAIAALFSRAVYLPAGASDTAGD